MAYQRPARNFEGIQFAALRKTVDVRFNAVHDELSAAYYDGTPFRTFGVPDKATFDKLHGLIFAMYDVAFHQANLALPVAEQIPASEYNEVRDRTGTLLYLKSSQGAALVAARQAEGLVLVI